MARVLRQPLRDRLAALGRDQVRRGQALVLTALMMSVLVAFTGLAVDVGVWLVAKARLQRAVDVAALSVILDRPTPTQTNGTTTWTSGACPTAAGALATTRSGSVIATQGVPTTQVTCVLTDVPRTNQLEVRAWQTVPTAFAKIIGVNQATINVTATADISSYIEIPASPVCGAAVPGSSTVCDGGVGDSTMDQFGRDRGHTSGDAYTNPTSPYYDNPDGTVVLPEGYLYRVHVEAGYTGALDIQVWDPDGFNKRNPRQWLDPSCPVTPPATCDSIPNPTFFALNDHRDGSGVAYPGTNANTSGNNGADMPSVGQDFYASGYHLFWRVDECNGGGGQNCRQDAAMTPIEFTLWSLDADAYDPLNPLPGERTDIERVVYRPTGQSTINCSTAGASRPGMTTPSTIPCTTVVYTCTSDSIGNVGNNSCPDLRWVRLFNIPNVNDVAYPPRADGTRSFFIYVRPLGSTNTENVYHLRSGPPPGNTDQVACQQSGVGGRSNWEDVNNQATCQWNNGRPGADRNTKVYARRSMPVNVMQAGGVIPYIVWLGYIPKTAAGQTLRLRQYDLDANSNCDANNRVRYLAWFPSDDRRTLVLTACGSTNGNWQEDLWTVPPESNTAFWGTDTGFWVYADVFQKGGIFWDTAVFEVIFNRARLLR